MTLNYLLYPMSSSTLQNIEEKPEELFDCEILGNLGRFYRFSRPMAAILESYFDWLLFTICPVGYTTVINLLSYFLGDEVVYRHIYIAVLTFWWPSWTPSWILEKAPAGITGSFSMLFLMVFGKFPVKFSLGIFFPPLKPNTIRLIDHSTVNKFNEFVLFLPQ